MAVLYMLFLKIGLFQCVPKVDRKLDRNRPVTHVRKGLPCKVLITHEQGSKGREYVSPSRPSAGHSLIQTFLLTPGPEV